MLSESEIQAICRQVIELSPAPATEVRLTAEKSGLTRLANSEVSQSIDQDRASLTVRVLLGPPGGPTRAGLASSNRLDEAGLAEVVRRANAAAEMQHQDPSLLPPVGPQTYRQAGQFDPATADCPPSRRTEPLHAVLARCRREGLTCAGVYSTGAAALGMANSSGLFAFDRRTEAELSLTISRDNASGWDERLSARVGELDPAVLAERAIDLAVRGRDARPTEPGPYTVVLPPAAVADLLWFLAFGGLSAKAILEGHSLFAGKLGQQVFGPNVTITDDAYDPLTAGLAFDFEGLPRQRLALIERGVFKRMVHSRETARAAKAEPTGHGLPPPTAEGAIPLNLSLATGDADLAQMIAAVDRGLLVTHFHYTNILRPADLTLTGMTRDGLFLIEGGRITRPVNNMRFTESLAHAFNNVTMIGREASRIAGLSAGYFAAPALTIRDFNFSSGTEF